MLHFLVEKEYWITEKKKMNQLKDFNSGQNSVFCDYACVCHLNKINMHIILV